MVTLPPRLVIAAPASGHGKTTVATGLMAAWARRGRAVVPFKVGPDYIDPGYHAMATGRPGRNLDPYLCGPELIAPLFAYGSQGSDVAVVEGVMGLYDGAAGHGDLASTAHVARLLAAPVVLVVDARAQGRSVAALVRGFADFDRSIRIAGVILNRVGSDRHERILRDALADGPPVLGILRRDPGLDVPSRHLGLIPAAERAREARATVAALGEAITASCDLDALAAVARTASARPPQNTAPALPGGGAPHIPFFQAVKGPRQAESGSVDNSDPGSGDRPIIAMAGGPAFTFAYAEHAELLAAAGADVATFDPLRDESLPEGTRAVIIGGGFPETHLSELAANAPLRTEIAAAAAHGMPIVAECAGLAYLARSLDDAPMCGVLPATAAMTGRLTLGYREARAASASVLAPAGTPVRGHEFHRTALDPAAGSSPAWTWDDDCASVREGFVHRNVHASYLHTHWAAHPGFAHRLVAAARRAPTGTEARA